MICIDLQVDMIVYDISEDIGLVKFYCSYFICFLNLIF